MHFSAQLLAAAALLARGTRGETCAGQQSSHQCGLASACTASDETVVRFLCSGSASNVCCLAGDTSQCTAEGGICKTAGECEGQVDTTMLSDKCPGSAAIKCCVANGAPPPTSEACAGETLAGSECASTCGSSSTRVDGLCSERDGEWECCLPGSDASCKSRGPGSSCLTVSNCATTGGTAHSGLCPGSSNVKCCSPPVPPPGPEFDKCFPMQQDSLRQIDENWGGRRGGGARCHAGVDILTNAPGHVVAVEDGEVVNVFNFMSCKDGWGLGLNQYVGPKKLTKAVLVYSAASDTTYNYGEVDFDKITVSVGDRVVKGQRLGVASYCGMLHFEIYTGRRWANSRWYPASGGVSTSPDGCARHYMSTKPPELDDPRVFLAAHKETFCAYAGRMEALTIAYTYIGNGSSIAVRIDPDVVGAPGAEEGSSGVTPIAILLGAVGAAAIGAGLLLLVGGIAFVAVHVLVRRRAAKKRDAAEASGIALGDVRHPAPAAAERPNSTGQPASGGLSSRDSIH